jgi:hypothetical protein
MVLMSRLTTFVLKSSTHAKAELGGFSASICEKSRIKKTGSYNCASWEVARSVDESSKRRHVGKLRQVRSTVMASRLWMASREVDDDKLGDDDQRLSKDAIDVFR